MAQTVSNFGTGGSLRHSRIGGFEQGAISVLNVLLNWAERRRTRRQLYQMPDYMLQDIGVSRAEVETEWTKPFWKA